MRLKLNFWWVLIIILISIPITAYIDLIQIGYHPYRQYFAICAWEAGLIIGGIALGMLIEQHNTCHPKEQEVGK